METQLIVAIGLENTGFDFASFYLTVGFAIFVALLAWGNQIKGARYEVQKLEDDFRKEFDISKKNSNKLIKEAFQAKTVDRATFLQQSEAILDVFENPKIKEKNLGMFEQFQELHGIRSQLEGDFKKRYNFTIYLCSFSILCGVISIFVEFLLFDLFSLTIISVLVVLLIINFVRTNRGENLFIEKIGKINDNIEAGN